MLFKDLVRKFLLQQQNIVKHKSAESASQVVHSSEIKRRVTGNQAPSEFEINMTNSIKEDISEINEKSLNNDQLEVDQLQLLQDLKLQEWYQEDLQGYSEKEIQEDVKKELISLSSSGHEVYGPAPRLLSQEDPRFSIQKQPFGDSNVSCMVSEIHRHHGRSTWLSWLKSYKRWIFHKCDQILAFSQDAIHQAKSTS